MSMRWGFKSEANWYSREMRRELKRQPHESLCPWDLAEHLGFPVVPLTQYRKLVPNAVAYLESQAGQKDFSAVTLFSGTKRLIIHNDGHSEERQAADIAHELAHGLLLHPPKPAFDTKGSRHYDKVLEAEANWLGPALLVSEEAALHITENRISLVRAAKAYGVSAQLMTMRINVTNAVVRVQRRSA